MSIFGAFVSKVLGTAAEVSEKEGSEFITDALTATGVLTDEARAFADEHPNVELTAVLSGAAALLIFKPGLARTAGKLSNSPLMKTVISQLVKRVSPGVAKKAVNIASSVIVNELAQNSVEDGVKGLFKYSNSLLNTIQGNNATPLVTFHDIDYANGTSALNMVSSDYNILSRYSGLDGTGQPILRNIKIDSGATVGISDYGLGTGIGDEITFLGSSDTLRVGNPSNFPATIFNFKSGNTIDLTGVAATSATLGANNVLTVQENDGGSLNIDLAKNQNYTGDSFTTSSDGNGGSIITPSLIYMDFDTPIFTGTIFNINDNNDIAYVINGNVNGAVSNLNNVIKAYNNKSSTIPLVKPPTETASIQDLASQLNSSYEATGLDVAVVNNRGMMAESGFISEYNKPISFIYNNGIYSVINNPYIQYSNNTNGIFGNFVGGISNNGYVVGEYSGNDSSNNAINGQFIYNNGVFENIYPIINGANAADITLNGVNNSGEIVGNDDGLAFLYNNAITSLINDPYATSGYIATDPDPVKTVVTGINDSGVIVGYYGNETGIHGFVDINGKFITLDNPLGQLSTNYYPNSGGTTEILGINNKGEVIGSYFSSNYPLVQYFIANIFGNLQDDSVPKIEKTVGSDISYDFSSIAEIIQHTKTVGQDAVIQVTPHDTITLDNVTKAQLKAHQNDFLLHA